MTKDEFDADPKYNGQSQVRCSECEMEAAPSGRDAPAAMPGCNCSPGPMRGCLWPGETREQFGYPQWLAEEAASLRAQFYPPTLSDEQLEDLQVDIARAVDTAGEYDDEIVATAVTELLRLRAELAAAARDYTLVAEPAVALIAKTDLLMDNFVQFREAMQLIGNTLQMAPDTWDHLIGKDGTEGPLHDKLAGLMKGVKAPEAAEKKTS